MRTSACLTLAATLAVIAARPATAQMASLAAGTANTIDLSEIRTALARADQLNFVELVALLRPGWARHFGPGAPRPVLNAAVSSPRQPCREFRAYLDRAGAATQPRDVWQISLVPPHTGAADRDCGTVRVVTLAEHYGGLSRADALATLRDTEDVTLEDLNAVFQSFGLTWRPEPPNLVVYTHQAHPACGGYREPTDPVWSVMPGIMRDEAIRLLACIETLDSLAATVPAP